MPATLPPLTTSDQLTLVGVTLVASVSLTWFARVLARRLNFVDRPDAKLKQQAAPVALMGGAAVLTAWLVGGVICVPHWMQQNAIFLLCAAMMCGLGLVDDLLNIRPRTKLIGQFVISGLLLTCSGLVDIQAIGLRFSPEGSLSGGAASLYGGAIAFGCLIVLVNAINLLDGMDGTASVFAIGTAIGLATIGGADPMALALAAAVAGFLFFNRPPASIYLGDAGSLTVGFVLTSMGLAIAGRPDSSAAALIGIALLFSIPVLDTCLAVFRRRCQGYSFSSGDRGHVHHRLQAVSASTGQALNIWIAWVTTFVCASVAFALTGSPLFLGIFPLAILVLIRSGAVAAVEVHMLLNMVRVFGQTTKAVTRDLRIQYRNSQVNIRRHAREAIAKPHYARTRQPRPQVSTESSESPTKFLTIPLNRIENSGFDLIAWLTRKLIEQPTAQVGIIGWPGNAELASKAVQLVDSIELLAEDRVHGARADDQPLSFVGPRDCEVLLVLDAEHAAELFTWKDLQSRSIVDLDGKLIDNLVVNGGLVAEDKRTAA